MSSCTKTGCSEHATGVCQGCHTAAYCGQVHMEEDWASHRHACNFLAQSHVRGTMWAVEAEINEAQDKDGEQWVPMQLVHQGHKSVKDHIVDNEHLAEEIGARAEFQNDLSILRGVQRLPSGSMHNGERVSVYVKTATFETEVSVQLPGRAHYNIFKRDGGYNVYLTREDIRRNGQFRPVPLKGMIAVGLGTAEQKALVFGDYSITQLAPEKTALRALDFFRRVVRRPRLIRLRGIDRATQMAVSITMEQAVSVGSEGLGNPDAVYSISYIEIYVPYLFQSGNAPDLSWTAVFEKELSEDATRTAVSELNAELKVEAAIASLAELSPDALEEAIRNHDGFDALHPEDAAFVANTIGAFVAEEVGAESPFHGGDALEDAEDGLIGALVTDGMADAHDQTGQMQLDEIGANVISRWLKRRRAKRAAKKRQQQQTTDDVNAQIQVHLDTIGPGIRDYVSRKRNLARQRKGVDGMSISELETKLIDTVKQIKQARAAKRVAGDKIRLANSILTKLDNRGKGLSPAAQQASAELVDLTKGTSAVRAVKRKQARATAARVKRAGQDAIDNGPSSSSDSQSEEDSSSAVENPSQTAALVSALLQCQDGIRAEKKQLVSQGKTVPAATTRMDEDLSKIASILTQHIEALCNDAKGTIEYDVIPDTVLGAFERGLMLHRQLTLVPAVSGKK